MIEDRIGRLFPAGGPVPPDLVIGRTGEIAEIVRRLGEGLSTLLTGARRIGKTTVCDAACAQMVDGGSIVIRIEVPERPGGDAGDLLQLIVERCRRLSPAGGEQRLLRTVRPLIEKTLRDYGLPLDLSQLAYTPGTLPVHRIVSLPIVVARELRKPVVVFFDELQRAVAYTDGKQVVGDLVDVYSGHAEVTVLIDGSDERAFELLDPSVQLGKLCRRLALGPTIPSRTWREALPDRFERAGLELAREALEIIVDFGAGRPYPTMAAAQNTALNARRLMSTSVGVFEAQEGVAEAARQLGDEDG